ncbi:MAG: HDOD domain-containing protein [candidate division Zixibacteria bacterium]|jgi:HD-like signal output (HDOD) protein|nr:HDOD domain-containing protein [candidate division Zixibacteria bacterium]
MDKLTILNQIQRSQDLLSMPQAISEILGEMDKPEFSNEALSRIILKDASLTARILRLANSPFYHRLKDIKNVSQAIQVLGSTTVKCLALSSSVLNPGHLEKTSGVNVRSLFSSILTVAAAAEKIAKGVAYRSPDVAFVSGLLHHVGVLFFLHHYPKDYRRIIARDVKAVTLLDAEREVFGIDHAEVGWQLCRRWRLPNEISEAVRDHHAYTGAASSGVLQNSIRLAALLADDTVTTFEADLEQRIARVNALSEALHLPKESIDTISSSLIAETVRIAQYLDIDIGSIEETITRANKEIWRMYLMVENLFKERQELSAKLLNEERAKGAILSENIAIATMSHYLNNATMAVYGRAQIMRKWLETGANDKLIDRMPATLDVIEKSVRKIKAVLLEIKEISPIDEVKFYDMSQALNLDERIAARMATIDDESGLVLPEEAADVHMG